MTTTVLDTNIGEVEIKIPDVSVLEKKTNYNARISDIEKKYLTTSDNNRFTSGILDAKMKKELVYKSSISNLVKNSNWNTELETLAMKNN